MISTIALGGGDVVVWNHDDQIILKYETKDQYQGLVLPTDDARQIALALLRATKENA